MVLDEDHLMSTRSQITRILAFVVGVITIILIWVYQGNRYSPDTLRNSVTEHEIIANNLPLDLLWSQTFSQPINGRPLGNEQFMFMFVESDLLVAFENESGRIAWQYKANAPTSLEPNLALSSDTVFLSELNHLVALDTETGERSWGRRFPITMPRPPDVLVIGDVVVVAKRYAGTFIAAYDVHTGDVLWDLTSFFNRATSYSGLLDCSEPFIPPATITPAICLFIDTEVFVINPSEGQVVHKYVVPFSTSRNPQFRESYLFAGTDKGIKVFDAFQNIDFILPANCLQGFFTKPVFFHERNLLTVTGCDEAYTLSIDSLYDEPKWVFSSSSEIASSFVTVNGQTGFILNRKAEIEGIDLNSGESTGKLTTMPTEQVRDRHYVNGLYVNSPYIYAIIDEGNLLVFKQI
jgi:outer membrane protein assembly factor BamB